MTTVVFLALGTRGDVQPLASLACYLNKLIGHEVAVATHLNHKVRDDIIILS